MSENGVQECCQNEDNLEDAPPMGELRVRVCRECGRRHFEVDAEPLTIGVEPAAE